MSDKDEKKEVFAWFGAASYFAQCVEVELWIARLVLAREGDADPAEHDWQRIESEPLTMGGLLGLIEKGIELDPTELEILDACRKKRNWLSHNYWEQRSHLLVSSEGCQQAVEDLAELCEFFKRGDKTACRVSARIRAHVGIPERLVQGLRDEYVRRLQSGESHDSILQDQEERIRRLNARVTGEGGQGRVQGRSSSRAGSHDDADGRPLRGRR